MCRNGRNGRSRSIKDIGWNRSTKHLRWRFESAHVTGVQDGRPPWFVSQARARTELVRIDILVDLIEAQAIVAVDSAGAEKLIALDGTDGSAPPSVLGSGTGIRGWLRSIYEKLTGSLAVTVASFAGAGVGIVLAARAERPRRLCWRINLGDAPHILAPGLEIVLGQAPMHRLA